MNPVRTFLIDPFDITLHESEDGVQALQARFATWLRTLSTPARFLCWQMPATLDPKITELAAIEDESSDTQRRDLVIE